MKKSLSPFLLEFLFKLLLIQPEVNHNSIQSFHLNQEFSLIKFSPRRANFKFDKAFS